MKKACYENRRSVIDSCSKRILPTVTQRYSNYTDNLYPYQSISFKAQEQPIIHKEHLSLPKVSKSRSIGVKSVQKRNKYQKILFQKLVVKQNLNKQHFIEKQVLEQFQRTAYLRLKKQRKKKARKQTFYESVQGKKMKVNVHNMECLKQQQQRYGFTGFMDQIIKQIQQKKKYHHIINKDHIFKIIYKIQNSYFLPGWGMSVVELILQYLQYSQKQSETLPDKNIYKHLQFIRNFGKKINLLFLQIDKYTSSVLRTLKIFNSETIPINFEHQFHFFQLNFDLSIKEIQQIFQMMKINFQMSQKISLLLTYYLYKSCLQLQKRHSSIMRIEETLKQALKRIQNTVIGFEEFNQQRDSTFQLQENVKKNNKFQRGMLQLKQVQKSKRQQLINEFIQENIELAIQNYKFFIQIVNGIRQKHPTVKMQQKKTFDEEDIVQSISQIKRMLFRNKISTLDIHQIAKLNSKMSIHTLVNKEQELVNEQIKVLCQYIQGTLVFDIDSMITEVIVCKDLREMIECCSQLQEQMNTIDQKQIKLINIKAIHQNQGIKHIEKEFKLSIYNTPVIFSFILDHQYYSKKIKETITAISSSRLFSPLTSLKMYHQYLANSFLREVNSIIQKKVNLSSLMDIVSYSQIMAIQQHIKQGISVPLTSLREPSIKYFNSLISRFHKIQSIKSDKFYQQYELQQALNIAQFQFQLNNFQSAIDFYLYYSQIKERQFLKDQQNLLKMLKQTPILKRQFFHFLYCLDRLGLLFRLVGKLSESIVYYKRFLQYQQRYIKHESYSYLKTLFAISCNYQAKNNKEEGQIYKSEALKIIGLINQAQNKQVYTRQQFLIQYELKEVLFQDYILK